MSIKAESSVNTKSSLYRADSPKAARLFFALSLILIIFLGATYFALNQSPKPDPYTKATAWENFYYPQEKNAFVRLPIINATLNDIFVLPNSQKLWAVGDNGLIVHSPDGGITWEQQTFPGREVSLTQLIQPDIDVPLFTFPVSFSLFNSAQAASKPEGSQLKSVNDLKNFNDQSVEQFTPIQQTVEEIPTAQEDQQQIEELPLFEEAPADEPSINPLPILHEVHFVNETTGFIVGENGTILKTEDGGQQWQLQAGGTDQLFYSVTFLEDGQQGWVVGRNAPLVSPGVILVTKDGGNNWAPLTV